MTPGSITSVAGVLCGHFTDTRRPTGCTVILTPDGAVAGVDVRGAAPGTRETELLSPLNSVEKIHAVLLAGGSAFGLDAAGGVMRWLEERGIGVRVGPARIPIVPAAILFDLFTGDPAIRPDAQAGYAACAAASRDAPAEGNAGAGAGAVVGKLFGIGRAMKGGVGSTSVTVNGITVAALVVVNAVGDVIEPGTGRVIAGARSADGRTTVGTTRAMLRGETITSLQPSAATTLAVVATDAVLTKAEANKLAQMAHDGLARTIDPVHTASDGDTVFALGTGASGLAGSLTVLGALAAEVTARAVLRAVWAADGLYGPGLPELPAARDLHGPPA
ncbi:P1 family peptidase [Piscinibacter sp.]|uniref:P1 family peptidase n=1 Tax=Piscinibacter sp. TaxID=1903157 RepID=UPI002D061960|nr:P1 family peptidase [Albitalea sp.]HUG24054.1 P1 family peptidase [Albitalea sp.]